MKTMLSVSQSADGDVRGDEHGRQMFPLTSRPGERNHSNRTRIRMTPMRLHVQQSTRYRRPTPNAMPFPVTHPRATILTETPSRSQGRLLVHERVSSLRAESHQKVTYASQRTQQTTVRYATPTTQAKAHTKIRPTLNPLSARISFPVETDYMTWRNIAYNNDRESP